MGLLCSVKGNYNNFEVVSSSRKARNQDTDNYELTSVVATVYIIILIIKELPPALIQMPLSVLTSYSTLQAVGPNRYHCFDSTTAVVSIDMLVLLLQHRNNSILITTRTIRATESTTTLSPP